MLSNDVILKAKNGDKDSLLEVIEQCDVFIKQFISIHFKLSLDKAEEVYNSAIIGLLTAMKNFDVNKGVKLTTFARKQISKEIIDFLSRDGLSSKAIARKNDIVVATYDLVSLDNKNDVSIVQERVGENDESLLAVEDKLLVEQFMATLSEADADLIADLFFNEKSVKELAKKHNYSERYIFKKRSNAFKEIRREVLYC